MRALLAPFFLGEVLCGGLRGSFQSFAVFGLARNGGVQPPKRTRDLALATNLLSRKLPLKKLPPKKAPTPPRRF